MSENANANEKTYLICFKPLEPYTFGSEDGFKFDGVRNYGKESYMIDSKEMPEQTTILGTLRYLILQQSGILKTDFRYSAGEKRKMHKLIGPATFRFGKVDQDFGIIKELSPVFLYDTKEKDYYVPTPFNNKNQGIVKKTEPSKGGTFIPMKLAEEPILTSAGEIHVPKDDQFVYKEEHASGFFNISKGKDEKAVFDSKTGLTGKKGMSLFQSAYLTGNRKNGRSTNKESFFRREVKILHKDMSFAVFLTISSDSGERNLLENLDTVCYMGQKRSAFRVTAIEKQNDLESEIKKAFKTNDVGVWYYAFSDILKSDIQSYQDFAFTEKKSVRNLITDYSSGNYTGKRKKHAVRYHLIKKGSVFYVSSPLGDSQQVEKIKNSASYRIGYNHLIEIK